MANTLDEIKALASTNPDIKRLVDELYSRDVKIRMYENVLSRSPPHRHASNECCNPKCKGQWGTGCYCCHHGKYAINMAPDEDPGPKVEKRKDQRP